MSYFTVRNLRHSILLLLSIFCATVTRGEFMLAPSGSLTIQGKGQTDILIDADSWEGGTLEHATFDFKSKSYGLQAGFLMNHVLIGAEYFLMSIKMKLTSPKLENSPYPSGFRGSYKGVFIGLYGRANYFMPWGSYIFDVEFDYGSGRSKDSGKGLVLGLAYIGFRHIIIGVQYRRLNLSSKGFNDSEDAIGSNKLLVEEYLASITTPLWFHPSF